MQTSQFVEGARQKGKTPRVLDITVPSVKLRLDTGPRVSSPTVECSLNGAAAHISVTPASHDETSGTFDCSASLRHLEASLCVAHAEQRLSRPENCNTAGDVVALLSTDGLEASVDSRPQHSCTTLRSTVLHTHLVTPAFDAIAKVMTTWQEALNDVVPTPEVDQSAALLIYRMVRAAIEQAETQSQPGFANESRYGLHLANEQSIRDNPGWRLLTTVRHWMRTLSAAQDVSDDDIATYTINSLLSMESWEFDTENIIREQRAVQVAFGIEPAAQSGLKVALDWVAHLFVKLDVIHLVHEGRRLEDSAVETSAIKVISTSVGLRRSRKHKSDHYKNEVQSVNTVRVIEIDIRNNVLPAIQPLLVLVPKAGVHTGRNRSSRHERELWSITADNHIDSATVHFTGGGLRLGVGLQKGSMNLHVTAGIQGEDPVLPPSMHLKANLHLHKLDLKLTALDASKAILALPDDGVISDCFAQEIRLVLDHRNARPKSTSRLRMALSLNHFDFDVRPQLRGLAAFGVDWKKHHYP